MQSAPIPPPSGEVFTQVCALAVAAAVPVIVGAALGAGRKLKRLASRSGGQPLRINETARAASSGAVVGGLLGTVVSAAAASLLAALFPWPAP